MEAKIETQRDNIATEPSPKDAAIDFVAGSLGGIVAVYVGQPLDTVKVKMQAFPSINTGMTSTFAATLRKDGVSRGLYAGTVPALAANVAENSVLFAAYGLCQKGVAAVTGREDVLQLNPVENAVAGFCAAFFSSFTLCPTELVKCRLQAMRELQSSSSASKGHLTPWALSKQIYRTEGIPGFFRGLTSTMTREMPGYFFFFGGYEATRILLTPEGKTKEEIGVGRTVVAGGVGGCTLWAVIFPSDVVKSRIQVQGSRESMRSVFRGIVKSEGVMALYNGLLPTLVRTFPATGALFLAYEYSRKYMHYLVG
ncbi:unnamed protein product, partial [Darwinula stevensoni]